MTATAPGPKFAHTVFFTLAESTPENRRALVAACDTHLDDHPGTLFYAAGARIDEMQRDVNDREFDVSLHLVFASRADHDAYQQAPRHDQFIAENKESWRKVRVFDSEIA